MPNAPFQNIKLFLVAIAPFCTLLLSSNTHANELGNLSYGPTMNAESKGNLASAGTCTGFTPIHICVGQTITETVSNTCNGVPVSGSIGAAVGSIATITPTSGTTPQEFSITCDSPGNTAIAFSTTFFCGSSDVNIECTQSLMCDSGCTNNPEPSSVSVPQCTAPDQIDYDIEEVYKTKEMLDNISPYLTSSASSSLTLEYDVETSGNSLPDSHLYYAKAIVESHNRILAASKAGESIMSEELVDTRLLVKLEPYFAWIATEPSGGCGNFFSPAACPDRTCDIDDGYYLDRAGAEAAIVTEGFRRTLDYAGGSNPNDFTMPLANHPCGPDTFRSHGLIRRYTDMCWSFNTQTPEPNPEIFNYNAPGFITSSVWRLYVTWWHREFC